MLVQLEGELDADVERMATQEAAEDAEIEVVVANAVAQFAVGILALCPEVAAIDAFLDDELGDFTPFVHQEERTLEHHVRLHITGRGTVPVFVQKGKCAAAGTSVPGGRILGTGEIGVVDEILFFLFGEDTAAATPREVAVSTDA